MFTFQKTKKKKKRNFEKKKKTFSEKINWYYGTTLKYQLYLWHTINRIVCFCLSSFFLFSCFHFKVKMENFKIFLKCFFRNRNSHVSHVHSKNFTSLLRRRSFRDIWRGFFHSFFRFTANDCILVWFCVFINTNKLQKKQNFFNNHLLIDILQYLNIVYRMLKTYKTKLTKQKKN